MSSNSKKNSYRKIFYAINLSIWIAPVAAFAQASSASAPLARASAGSESYVTLDDVVVTAERRSSSVQNTAAAISVRDGKELAQQGRFSVQDILYDVPGVTAPNSSTAPSLGGSDSQGGGIVIRGIAANPGGGGAGSPLSGSSTTAVYTDGVYEGIGGDFDLQRLEVLRGPQGTLYGRSATSGVVAIHTNDPTFDAVTGDLTAQFGNFGQRRLIGALNVPLSDTFAVRASIGEDGATSGYRNGKGDAFDRLKGRVKALYRPNDNVSALLGFAFDQNNGHTGGCRGSSPADGVVAYDTCFGIRSAETKSYQYWASIEWDLGPATLFYLPAYRTFRQASSQDQNGPFNVPMSQVLETPEDTFLTQELRLASKSGGKLDWQAGFFQYWNKAHTENANRWTNGGALLFASSTHRDVQDYGLFGELNYAFTDSTRMTLGARYDYTRVSTRQTYTANLNFLCNTPAAFPTCPPPGGAPGQPELNLITFVDEDTNPSGLNTWHSGNYKVRLEHDIRPDNLVYGMVSTGFVPGDVNVTCGAQACSVQPYDAESLTAFELGNKNSFFNRRLQVNADVFLYRYAGMITEVNPDANNPVANFTTTVPVQVWGLEFESNFQVSPEGRFGLRYTHLDSQYRDKLADFAAQISWKEVANAGPPNYNFIAPDTVSASYEHTFNIAGGSTLFARINGTWTSRFRYFNPSNTALSNLDPGPGLLNYVYMDSGVVGDVNVNWTSPNGKLGIGAYIRNFTDRRWTFYDVRSLSPRLINATETAPRTYGMLLTAHF